MEYRQLDQSFEKQYGDLLRWNFGADITSPFFKYIFSHPEYWANIYGWVDEGTLVTCWNQVPMEVVIRNKKVKTYFIEDAITSPDYRNQGLIQKSFLANCKLARKENVDFIILTPFKHDYYAKFGFSSAFNRFRLKTPMNLISKTGKVKGFVVKAGELKDNAELRTDFYHLLDEYWENAVYNERRYPVYWEKYLDHIKNQRVAVVYKFDAADHKSPQGFLVYSEKDRELLINGYRYSSFGAFNTLKHYILAHLDQVDSIHCTSLPEDFPIDSFVHSYWVGKKQVVFSYEPSKMLRIVSPRSALEIHMRTSPKSPIRILISDQLLPENSGVYYITENHEVHFQETGPHDLEISISSLAQLITGRFSVYDLYRTNEITLPETNGYLPFPVKEFPQAIHDLDEVYPKELTFFPEFD